MTEQESQRYDYEAGRTPDTDPDAQPEAASHAARIAELEAQVALAHKQLLDLSEPGEGEPHAKMWHSEARRLAAKYNENTFYHSGTCRVKKGKR